MRIQYKTLIHVLLTSIKCFWIGFFLKKKNNNSNNNIKFETNFVRLKIEH